MKQQYHVFRETIHQKKKANKKEAGFSFKVIFFLLIILVILAGLGYGGWKYFSQEKSGLSNYIFASVERGTFTHEVTGKGTAESAQNEEIKSQVGGSATINWIIDEGTTVKKGDVLVELDSTSIDEKLSSQQVTYSNSVATVASSQATLKNAELSLEEYIEGTFEKSFTTIENSIYSATETKKQKADSVRFTERLLKANYTTNTQLEVDQVSYQQAENTLKTSELEWIVLMKYSSEKEITSLMSDIENARTKLESNIYENERAKERLDFYTQQQEACSIKAPKDGQVVYANQDNRWRSESDMIKQGASVYESQVLIRLPDPTQMQVKAMINESNISAVKPGQSALISFDAIPNKVFKGSVKTVSQYPKIDWMSSSKDYETIVSIENAGNLIRAGLTAEVRIIADRQEDVLMVPVQCLIEVGKKTFCLKANNREVFCKEVLVSSSNAKNVIILAGLDEGESVISGARLYKDSVAFPSAEEASLFVDNPLYQKSLEAKEKEQAEEKPDEQLEKLAGGPGGQAGGFPGGQPGGFPGGQAGGPGGQPGGFPGGQPPKLPEGVTPEMIQKLMSGQEVTLPEGVTVESLKKLLAGGPKNPDDPAEQAEKSEEELKKEEEKAMLKRIKPIEKYFNQTAMELCANLDINQDKFISKWEIYRIAPEILDFIGDWDRNKSDKPNAIAFIAPKAIVEKIVQEFYADDPEKSQKILADFEKLNKNTKIGTEEDGEFPLEKAILEGISQKLPDYKEKLEEIQEKLAGQSSESNKSLAILNSLKQEAPELYALIEIWVTNFNKDKVNYIIPLADLENQSPELSLFIDDWNQILTKTDLVIGFCTARNLFQRVQYVKEEAKLIDQDPEELFVLLDTDKNSLLTEEEFAKAPEAKWHKFFFTNGDLDKDGALSREELLGALEQLKTAILNSTNAANSSRSGGGERRGGGGPPRH